MMEYDTEYDKVSDLWNGLKLLQCEQQHDIKHIRITFEFLLDIFTILIIYSILEQFRSLLDQRASQNCIKTFTGFFHCKHFRCISLHCRVSRQVKADRRFQRVLTSLTLLKLHKAGLSLV